MVVDIKSEINKITNNIEEKVIEIRRKIHMNPELGFEEEKTSEYISFILKEIGYEVNENIAKTGLTAVLNEGKKGPVIGIRADMDALPIQEKNEISYKSKNPGKMHACGHDGHTAILLGVAEVLYKIKDKINGSVKFIFQPAEEWPGGAKPMIDDGVLFEPEVDIFLALHIWADYDAGKVAIKEGPFFASIDNFSIEIKGKSAHGAEPHNGIDSIYISSQFIDLLQGIISREKDTNDPAIITIGKIEGGHQRNIIAEKVKLEGTVRCFDSKVRDNIEKRIKKILQNLTDMYNADYKIEYKRFYPPLINDKKITDLVSKTSREIVGDNNVIELKKPTMGGEDFAYFLKEKPGCLFLLGGKNNSKNINSPQHSSTFNFDESIMKNGIKILANTVLNYIED